MPPKGGASRTVASQDICHDSVTVRYPNCGHFSPRAAPWVIARARDDRLEPDVPGRRGGRGPVVPSPARAMRLLRFRANADIERPTETNLTWHRRTRAKERVRRCVRRDAERGRRRGPRRGRASPNMRAPPEHRRRRRALLRGVAAVPPHGVHQELAPTPLQHPSLRQPRGHVHVGRGAQPAHRGWRGGHDRRAGVPVERVHPGLRGPGQRHGNAVAAGIHDVFLRGYPRCRSRWRPPRSAYSWCSERTRRTPGGSSPGWRGEG